MDYSIRFTTTVSQPNMTVFQQVPSDVTAQLGRVQTIAWQTQATVDQAKDFSSQFHWSVDYEAAVIPSLTSGGTAPAPGGTADFDFDAAKGLVARLRSQSSLLDAQLRDLSAQVLRPGETASR